MPTVVEKLVCQTTSINLVHIKDKQVSQNIIILNACYFMFHEKCVEHELLHVTAVNQILQTIHVYMAQYMWVPPIDQGQPLSMCVCVHPLISFEKVYFEQPPWVLHK